MPPFETTLAVGKIGESQIAAWLRVSCNYNVLPVYEKEIHEGKGPVFWLQEGTNLIAPDLLVFKTTGSARANIRWIEAKTKSAFSWHRISQKWVTGIDLRHYNDYLKVADRSPWPVWLLFLHLEGRAKDSPDGSPTGLFGGDLAYLRQHENHRSMNYGPSGMVYWAHQTLKPLASLAQVRAAVQASQARLAEVRAKSEAPSAGETKSTVGGESRAAPEGEDLPF